MNKNKHAFRQWDKNTVFYVSELPGEGGKDWGYHKDYSKARLLTPYWQRRFRKDMERVNATARFTVISSMMNV